MDGNCKQRVPRWRCAVWLCRRTGTHLDDYRPPNRVCSAPRWRATMADERGSPDRRLRATGCRWPALIVRQAPHRARRAPGAYTLPQVRPPRRRAATTLPE